MLLQRKHSRNWPLALTACLLLTACDSLKDVEQLLGAPDEQPPLKGDRIAVLSYQNTLRPDALLEDEPIRITQPQSNQDFRFETALQQQGIENLKIDNFNTVATATAGDGNEWDEQLMQQPVVGDGIVFTMDASGVVSAHLASDISEVLWRVPTTYDDELMEIAGGGLAYSGGVIYVTTGYGSVLALVARDGSLLWRQETDVPIRSAPAVGNEMVLAVTIDNELLAYNARTGQSQWTHRGIREAAVYLGNVTPVIENGIAIVSYSSGELFAIRLEDGTPLWSDTLIATKRTSASAALTGIDATPLVHNNIVYAISNNGLMVANLLSNGRGIWDLELSSYHTPWFAGDYLFVISNDQKLIAIQAREKRIKWITDLRELVDDPDDLPGFTDPIMINNELALVGNQGEIWFFEPAGGTLTQRVDIPDGIRTSPVAAGGSLYLLDQSATLYQLK